MFEYFKFIYYKLESIMTLPNKVALIFVFLSINIILIWSLHINNKKYIEERENKINIERQERDINSWRKFEPSLDMPKGTKCWLTGNSVVCFVL